MTRISAILPQRIVCLTEETTETLYLLGEDWRIVGISGLHGAAAAGAAREAARVGLHQREDRTHRRRCSPIWCSASPTCRPTSPRELVRAGLEVHVFNHRSVAEILRMIRTLGGMIGCEAKAQRWSAQLEAGLDEVRARAAAPAAAAARVLRGMGRAA